MNADALRFPIGPFAPIPDPSAAERNGLIEQIPGIAAALRSAVRHLAPAQLQTPYRPGGWTVRQVVHHMADNDLNAYLRFKRALTEAEPLASSYREDLWAELGDYRETPIETSLDLQEALHCRFVVLLRSLEPADFRRTLRTQAFGVMTLDTALQRFVWHNRHHLAQIRSLIDREGWAE